MAMENGAATYDVLLIDVCLGPTHADRSGLEVVRKARAAGCIAPAILMSGILESELGPAAVAVGAEAWVPKFHIPALYATLELWTTPAPLSDGDNATPEALRRDVRLAQIAHARRVDGCVSALLSICGDLTNSLSTDRPAASSPARAVTT
jgi:CheY-like chemotaxis protein